MKKHLIKLISIVLVLVLSMLTLSSCGVVEYINGLFDSESQDVGGDKGGIDGNHTSWHFFPEGYTCGFPDLINKPAPRIEFWWVETYEECMDAINLLKSHGSTFAESAIFTYDGDLFDTKYCFQITLEHVLTEPIKFGDNPFKRRAGDVEITSYAFFEDVMIEQINHADVYDFNIACIEMKKQGASLEIPESFDNLEYSWNEQNTICTFYINGCIDNHQFYLYHTGGNFETRLSEECLKLIITSIEYYGID